MNTINWELLINYINGDCSNHEMQQVQQWCAEQTGNRYLLTYLERRQAELQQPLKQADIDEQWMHLLSRMFPHNNNTINDQTNPYKPYWFLGLAASLMLFSMLGWFYYKSTSVNNQLQFVQTNANTRSKVTLPDGTLVYLVPDSKISFKDFNGPKREVNLYGEAFFDVKHISNRPFIIRTTERLSITVLGTSFNVYVRRHTTAEVKVATGLVGVITDNHTHFLKAGEELTSNAESHAITIKPVIVKEASELQNGTLVFNNCDAHEIAQKIQRWYNIKVKVLPTAKKARRFSGEMKDTGMADLLNGLSYATGIHYQFEKTNTLLLF